MRLVKIEHVRCAEPDGYTYLLAADDLTQEQLDRDVQAAMTQYLAAKAAFVAAGPRPRWLTLDDFPGTTTLAEARQAIEASKAERLAWEQREREANGSFVRWLRPLGYRELYEAEEPEVLEATASWGHRHGEQIAYGCTETDECPKDPLAKP